MKDKRTIWVWHCNSFNGRYLFAGNPNADIPPYHFGDISNVLDGERLVWSYTRSGLKDIAISLWNKRFPEYRVKPMKIEIEIGQCIHTRSTKKKEEPISKDTLKALCEVKDGLFSIGPKGVPCCWFQGASKDDIMDWVILLRNNLKKAIVQLKKENKQ